MSGSRGLKSVKRFVKGMLIDVATAASERYSLSVLITSLCLRLPTRAKLFPRRVKLPHGIRLYVNDHATFYINVPDQYTRREYSRHGSYIPKAGWVVLDVGAYVGVYSLYASRLIGDRGLVVAFEPNPMAYYWLKRNLALNKCRNVVALPLALGSSDGRLEFYAVTRGNIGMSSPVRDHIFNALGGMQEYQTLYVPLHRLDKLVPMLFKKYHINRVDLAKIDVEGFEVEVLRGAMRVHDEGLITRLIVEVHLDTVKHEDIVPLLRKSGFSTDYTIKFNNVKEIIYARLTNVK